MLLCDFYVPEDDKRKSLVLDGQQRLQSLFIGLRGSYNGRELYFDLMSGELASPDDIKYRFRFLSPGQANFPWVQLKELVFTWAYCTQQWLTLRRSNGEKNVTRWSTRRKWTLIQSARIEDLASPLIRNRVREGNLRMLLNQAAGLALSIAALGDHSSLDTTLQFVGSWTEEKLRRRNLSFDADKESRRKRFIE